MIALLKDAKVRYSTFNILEDDEVRQGETIQKQASLFYIALEKRPGPVII